MKKLILTSVLTVLAVAVAAGFGGAAIGAEGDSAGTDNWANWRGPNYDGSSPTGNPPTEWSETENVAWKIELPGEGSASPIVWGDRVYALAAVDTGKKPGDAVDEPGDESPLEEFSPQEGRQERRPQGRRSGGRRRPEKPTTLWQFKVFCIDRASGDVVWETTAAEEVPHEAKHSTSTYASLSPVTDGKHLYCSFGSRGVFCLDMNGKVKWRTDLGDMTTRNSFGEGASPVLHGDSLVHIWDHEGDSFIACLDTATGDIRWKVSRDEPTTWNTPLITEHDGITHVIANGTNRTRSYDLATGKVIWECGGQVMNPIPSPMRLDDVVYCMSGYRGNSIVAIRLSARGDVTDSAEKIAWKRSDAAPYVASPLLYDDKIYLTKSRSAILSCLDARTGKPYYAEQRLPEIESLYSSLVGAGGKVYIVGRSGTTLVIEHGEKYKLLAVNKLDEGIDASPAIVGDQIFLRSASHLYCIAETESKETGSTKKNL